MTVIDRLADARRAAADFRRRGLWRFAAEADRRAAELHRVAHPSPPRRLPMPPGQMAEVVRLRPQHERTRRD